jgi:type II secretory pathway pseudopilin PulG
MRHTLRSHPAESLIETLIAIVVIVMATTASLSLIRTSLTGNEVIGEKVVALNLALEGIEAVRNIRDTNYLNFSSDPDNCWNKYDVSDVADCSSGAASEITDGNTYYLSRNVNPISSDYSLFEWTLVEVSDTTTDGFLDQYEYELSEDLDGDGSNDTISIYLQDGVNPAGGFTAVDEEAYQRLLTIDYNGESDSFELTSTVYWYVNGEQKSLSLTRLIANIY